MSDESLPAETKDPRIDAAFRDYLERLDRGEPIDCEDFLRRHAEIAGPLQSLIDAEEELRKLAGAPVPRESAEVSTQTFAAPGQDTGRPTLQPPPGTTGSELAGRFGRYEIIRALGRGAMGAVYLANDTQLKRNVAIKTPHFENDPSGELLQRFYREAEAAATLRNTNICPVYDVGQIDGKHFIAMAYIEGSPLSDLIKSGKPFNERSIVTIIRKLARALQEAHDHGIVHRDLKPSNIMVEKKGEPIIMDFGLARRRRAEGEASLTHSGDLVGSPAYMSPEQIQGDPDNVGPASDQYSLGVVLYEMLTGQLPFRGSVVNVLAQILTREMTRPSDLRPGLDPRIEAVCLRMMSKKASERFPSMKAVGDELAAIIKNPAAPPTTAEQSATASRAPAAATASPGEPGASQVRESVKQKALTESDVKTLEELVRKCLRRHDYDQMIQIIERIPEDRQNDALRTLLGLAREKVDEIAFLICDIEEADRFEDGQTALKKAEELLQIKPGHPRAREIQEKYSGYGDGGAARLAAWSDFTKAWSEGGWIPWSVLAFSLAALGVLLGVIYLSTTPTETDVQDSQTKVEAPAQGKAITIAVPKQEKVAAKPAEQPLKVTPKPPAAPTVLRKPPSYKILVPAYFYPGDQGWLEWERLFESSAREMLVVIVNPNSGPGEKPDPNYGKAVQRASEARLALIGYVDADHGRRPVSKMKEDIDRYSRFYPSIQGIFLDGQATSPAEVEHCAEVCEYARKKHNFRLIIANPGTVCAPEYFSRPALDAACLFDDPWRGSSLPLPPWTDKYADRIAVLVHEVRTAAQMRDLVQKAARKKWGYFFITDRFGVNPWDRLPSYWDDEVAAVQRLNEMAAKE